MCLRFLQKNRSKAHCQKFENSFIYNLKTVIDSNKIPTDVSKGGV